jgi:ribosomal protein S18 acetylase RimI-like enzyme
MIRTQDLPGTDHRVIIASADHARDIAGIYRSVLIESQVFLDLAGNSSRRSAAARRFIDEYGGFLSQPDEVDMQRCLQHGLIMVCLQHGKMLGFNRYVTDPDLVLQAFTEEFELDTGRVHTDPAALVDWSGNRKLNDYKTRTHVQWTDRENALVALRAMQAGLDNASSGRLAWAVDSAVHPQCRHLGIGKILSQSMRRAVQPYIGFLAYRMFEIRKINDVEIAAANTPSERTFVDSSSRVFAWTQEEIRISDNVLLTVRWNHWLKRYD